MNKRGKNLPIRLNWRLSRNFMNKEYMKLNKQSFTKLRKMPKKRARLSWKLRELN
ncbi:predicted protein [Botrytis cinerea T4]|uniref:Uncharacterized protein n=1 Tax=Botryotinia fuckeliana (strain T4) TaxID=999810 RepID=G2YL82_BOTF4|nr:predicted protein [Botrytis cinerea T4]